MLTGTKFNISDYDIRGKVNARSEKSVAERSKGYL